MLLYCGAISGLTARRARLVLGQYIGARGSIIPAKSIKTWANSNLGSTILGGLVLSAILAPSTYFFGDNGLSIGKAAFLLVAFSFTFGWVYYFSVLQYSDPAMTMAERAPFQRLRRRLEQGGKPAQIYDRGVAWLLEKLGVLLNDGDQQGSCWTAKGFDRCLLFAVAYPVLMMFVLWTLNGGMVGVAEAALGFEENVPNWRRALSLASFVPLVLVALRARAEQAKTDDVSWKTIAMFGAAIAGVVAVAGSITGIIAGAFALAFVGAVVGAFAFAFAVAVAFAFAFAVAFAFVVVVAVAFAVAVAEKRKKLHWFLPAYFITMLLVLLFAFPYFMDWQLSGAARVAALALFLPLLALVNAPFDWLSLGFTRLLLRKNLSKGGYWAVLLALLDLLAALFCLMLLALAMLWMVQAFNASVMIHGGAMVYDPLEVVAGLSNSETRWDPQYWWIHATLFSTLLPSLANMAIGALSLIRGIAPLNRYVLARLPENHVVHPIDKLWLPPVMALQMPLAIVLACGALFALGWLLTQAVMPGFSSIVLGMLGDIAVQDYPGAMMRWLLT